MAADSLHRAAQEPEPLTDASCGFLDLPDAGGDGCWLAMAEALARPGVAQAEEVPGGASRRASGASGLTSSRGLSSSFEGGTSVGGCVRARRTRHAPRRAPARDVAARRGQT